MRQINIFIATLLITFLLVALRFFFATHALSLTKEPPKPDVLLSLKPQLTEKVNTFQIKKDATIIPKVSAASPFDQANGYAITDFDNGTIIDEKNLSKKLPIASLTKLMTAVIALDLAHSDDVFTTSKRAATIDPTRMGVEIGEKITLETLLHGLLMTSANDAAEVIKEGIDEKYQANVFIEAMNRKAQFLGLTNTHFTNPQGFDNEDNYSTPQDLTILTHYALTNYPLFAEIVDKDYAFFQRTIPQRSFDLYNWNGLLSVYPGIMGVKIGNTDDAGTTTIVLSERDGKKILVVLLGAPGLLERDLWAAELLDIGFQHFNIPPANITKADLKEKYSTWKYFN